jgi:hypothetical protein
LYDFLQLRIKASTGRCIKCGTRLTAASFSAADLAALKSAVLGDVITRSDIYQTSSPEEHAGFLTLLETKEKASSSATRKSGDKNGNQFDVVIDGLNVALCHVPKQRFKVKPIG